jgi:hypothetical protein
LLVRRHRRPHREQRLLLFATAPEFEMLGKPWRLPCAIGYCCPIQPAISDGRLFVRLDNCVVCYDLRKTR